MRHRSAGAGSAAAGADADRADKAGDAVVLEAARVICYPMERGKDWGNHDRAFNVPGGDTVFATPGRMYAVSSFFSTFSPDGTKRIGIDEKSLHAAAYDALTSEVLSP